MTESRRRARITAWLLGIVIATAALGVALQRRAGERQRSPGDTAATAVSPAAETRQVADATRAGDDGATRSTPQPGAVGAALEPLPEPDAGRAFADLVAQVDCGPRLPGSRGARCAQDHIQRVLREHAERVSLQRFALRDPYGTDSLHLCNVIGSFHVQRAERLVLGAHYDTRPRADQEQGLDRDEPVPGANDGASGVAVLLEMARLLGGWDPGVGVDLVFFDGEDYGREGDLEHYLLGSRHFVEKLGPQRPRGMILLDMVGDRDLRIPMEGNSLRAAPDLVREVFDVARSIAAPGFAHEAGPAIYDDHIPFLRVGIPALDLIDFDYPPWHTTRDLPEQCSPGSLASVARVLVHSLDRLGQKWQGR